MAFEVADFESFLAILGQHPEWQVRLRRMLVDEATADSRREMNESFARLSDSGARLDERLARLTETVEKFSEETRARLSTLERDVGTLKEDVGTLKVDVGTLKGDSKEMWYRHRASGIFGRKLRGVRVFGLGEIQPIMDALDAGRISDEEWDDATLLDLIVSGVDRERRDVTVGVETSWKLDAEDVYRAARRTSVLRKAGLVAVAAVAGPAAEPEVETLARDQGVAVIRDGSISAWVEPS